MWLDVLRTFLVLAALTGLASAQGPLTTIAGATYGTKPTVSGYAHQRYPFAGSPRPDVRLQYRQFFRATVARSEVMCIELECESPPFPSTPNQPLNTRKCTRVSAAQLVSDSPSFPRVWGRVGSGGQRGRCDRALSWVLAQNDDRIASLVVSLLQS